MIKEDSCPPDAKGNSFFERCPSGKRAILLFFLLVGELGWGGGL